MDKKIYYCLLEIGAIKDYDYIYKILCDIEKQRERIKRVFKNRTKLKRKFKTATINEDIRERLFQLRKDRHTVWRSIVMKVYNLYEDLLVKFKNLMHNEVLWELKIRLSFNPEKASIIHKILNIGLLERRSIRKRKNKDFIYCADLQKIVSKIEPYYAKYSKMQRDLWDKRSLPIAMIQFEYTKTNRFGYGYIDCEYTINDIMNFLKECKNFDISERTYINYYKDEGTYEGTFVYQDINILCHYMFLSMLPFIHLDILGYLNTKKRIDDLIKSGLSSNDLIIK